MGVASRFKWVGLLGLSGWGFCVGVELSFTLKLECRLGCSEWGK